jgi:hypothetical protein
MRTACVLALAVVLLAPLNVAVAQAPPDGTGLVLDSLTGVSLPLIGEVGDIVIDQVVITDLTLVEDAAGAIIGLEATGTLSGTVEATGQEIVDQQFTTLVSVTSSGPGQCEVVGIDLGPIALDPLGVVAVDVPEAAVDVQGSGALGSLLCNLSDALSGVTGGVTRAVRGLVNAINGLI